MLLLRRHGGNGGADDGGARGGGGGAPPSSRSRPRVMRSAFALFASASAASRTLSCTPPVV